MFHATRFWPADWLLLSGGLAALGYYVLNIGLTAIVLCLVQGGTLGQVWQHWTLYTLPYYLLGSTLSIAWIFCSPQIHWQGVLVVVLFLYLVFQLFRSFVSFREGLEAVRAYHREVY